MQLHIFKIHFVITTNYYENADGRYCIFEKWHVHGINECIATSVYYITIGLSSFHYFCLRKLLLLYTAVTLFLIIL